jgi:phosphoglycolate phosphatase-like HAD superfamily hydrolase
MKVVAFDLDGVLVDSAALFSDVVKEALVSDGFPISGEAVARERIANVETWVGRLLPDNLTARAEVVSTLSAKVRAGVAKRNAALQMAPEALEVLSNIAAAHHLVLITNSSSAYTLSILARHRAEGLFERVITSDSPFATKEHAIAYLAHHYQVPLRDVIYVGDTVRDVNCAAAAGCRVIIVYTPWSWDFARRDAIIAARPNAVVKNLTEIMDTLSQWTQ